MEKEVIQMLIESSESSDSSGLEEELLNSSEISSSSSDEEEVHVKVDNFVETVKKYSDLHFKNHFRLNRETALHLIERYKTSVFFTSKQHGGQCRIDADKQIYMLLWYMGNTNTFREIGNLFGVSKSSAWRVISRTTQWILSIGHEYIKWPNLDKVRVNMSKFESMKKVPHVLGCIDCSHIKIKSPTNNKEAYFNRKHFYSLQLQAVVDADKMFVDIFVGEPGSLHDSRILRRSNLYRRASDNPQETFPLNSILLGDSAYATTDWLVSPFRDNGFLSPAEKQFNFIHSSTRMVVENAFGLLKTRFRRLLHFNEKIDLKSITNTIVCGCILHNICLLKDDNISLDTLDEENQNESENNSVQMEQNQIGNRRDKLFRELIQLNVVTLN